MKSITTTFILFFVFINFSIAQGHSDLSGLKAFYESTNGNNWANNEGWKNGVNSTISNPCDGWHGITCNADNRVIKIDLRVNNVTGEMPEEMLSIEFLEEVYFYYNNISGPVPAFFTEFEHLEEMNFSNNQLEGTIPAELGNSSSLKEISFRRNNLTGPIPSELSFLTNLERLDLSVNDLEGNIPSELGNLFNLTYLTLRANKLGGEIPESLTNLQNLRTLDIGSNNFGGPIPAFFGDLNSVLTLSLNQNNFTGELPESITNLTQIQNLNVGENNLSGVLFDIIIQLPVIRSLRAAKNNFSGTIPKNILDKTKLNVIDLGYNDFTGKIPGIFGEQSFFNELKLNNNDFSGCISQSYQNFCGDEDIDFSYNPKLPWQGNLNEFCMTSGSEEDQIGVACNVLNLVAETITDNCECLPSCDHPDYIGLMSIYSGTYGSGWYKRDGWKEGAAGDNCDPCSWYGVECNEDNRVISVDLKSNNLSGSLKDQIGGLTELQYLKLGGNQLSGEIPKSLYSLTNLIELNFGSTNFYGTISEKLGDLVNLTNFTASGGNISGAIPSTIGNLTQLKILSLSYNELSGELPEGITNLTQLTNLSLDGNNISGSLPENIGNLISLKSFRILGNQLSGSIPASLGDLDSLFILYLQNNNLSGCFDPNLLNLCDVGELRFTNNIDLSWGGEFDIFCETSGADEEQNGAFCGLGGSGVMDDCECIKSNDLCYTPEGILCKEWVQELITELECYDYGFGQRQSFSLAVSNFKEDPVLVAFIGGEFASEVFSTQNVYTCEGELLESCSYSLGTNCGDSTTIFSQLIPYPTSFYHCMEDTLPDCTQFVQHPDYMALAKTYNNTGGLYWTNNEGWKQGIQDPFSDPCDGWFGVNCDSNNRVTSIILENNNLIGEIPSSFGQLAMLEHLDLNTNKITGDAISNISNLTELSFLSLADNELSGPISSTIGELQNLTYLNLGWNYYSGNIPTEITNCTELVYLFFDVNNLTGEIPSEIAQLEKLDHLRFDDNDLSGCVPSEFHKFCFIDFNSQNNPKLPWSGDLNQFCNVGGLISDQVGAPCDDGNDSNGTNDIIHEECNCSPEIVSTEEINQRNLAIYPNPVTNKIFISGQLDGEIKYELIDVVGQTVLQSKLSSNQIILNDISQGIYFLKIYHLINNKIEVFKIVKE